MDPNNIPENIKNILRNKELTMSQKMIAFMAFMPGLPDNDPQFYIDNLKIGTQIKNLIDERKIIFNGFDDEFHLQVAHLDNP